MDGLGRLSYMRPSQRSQASNTFMTPTRYYVGYRNILPGRAHCLCLYSLLVKLLIHWGAWKNWTGIFRELMMNTAGFYLEQNLKPLQQRQRQALQPQPQRPDH